MNVLEIRESLEHYEDWMRQFGQDAQRIEQRFEVEAEIQYLESLLAESSL
jgi:hypothetical protein